MAEIRKIFVILKLIFAPQNKALLVLLFLSAPLSAVSLTLSGREPYDSQSNDNEKKERVEEIIRLKAKPLNRI